MDKETGEKIRKDVMSLILCTWAIAWSAAYDEGWCDGEEGIPHDEDKQPAKPNQNQLDQIDNLWTEVREELNETRKKD